MTDNPAIVAQLRTLEQLTRTENQVARLRTVQARTDETRRELEQNAEQAERRLARIQDALRELGAIPDVVGTVVGRAVALLKSQIEQAQRFDEALLGDLALERQLQDRARYLQALTANGPDHVHQLAGELVEAHTETVEWLTTVLAEEAVGGPASLRATPLQVVRDGVTQVIRMPARITADGVNRAGHGVAQARDRVREFVGGMDRAARDTRDVLETGLDAALDRAEEVARRDGATETADAVQTIRRERGTLRTDELPIANFDELSVPDAVEAVRGLESPEDLTAVQRYEEKHKNRSGVLTVIRSRHAEVAEMAVS